MTTDFQLDQAAYDHWLNAEGTDNLADLERAKRMLPIVLNECVTATQRDYIIKYFIDGMKVREIAELYGVNQATVSRTIRRGLDKASGYLRFVSTTFVNATKQRRRISNGRKRQRKEQ